MRYKQVEQLGNQCLAQRQDHEGIKPATFLFHRVHLAVTGFRKEKSIGDTVLYNFY